MQVDAEGQRKSREKQFHDKVFAEGGRAGASKFYSVTKSSRARYLDAILEAVSQGPVLEFGCGAGSTAFHLATREIPVIGIDISTTAIEKAQARAERDGLERYLEFREMDAEALDLPDASVEVVCGRGIIHHLDLERAFAEVARVLKPGGSAIFLEPLGHNPVINWYRDRTPEMRTEDEHPIVVADLDLAARHFRNVTMEPFHLASMAAIPLRSLPVFESIVKSLESVDRTSFRLFPFLRKHAWAAVLVLNSPIERPA